MPLKAVFFDGRENALVARIQELRKSIFVDQRGWKLALEDEREADQFDTLQTVHMGLHRDGRLCGTFRATRTDQPYLSAAIFPVLAVTAPYPHRRDAWEISRFGILGAAGVRDSAPLVFALMFHFAQQVQATTLVAVTDLAFERCLTSLGIRTRRYGMPQIVGADRKGRPIRAVAGEIPVAAQSSDRLAELASLLSNVEIVDAAEIFRPARVSA